MAKIDAIRVLDELQETYNNYMDAISKVEDSSDLDSSIKFKAASIIQNGQIHIDIALDTITN